ncbi:unnamed protein product [Ilex paraguariensis]|uniref:GDSL esterase/lipase n=1 Tax=Ilex paraguariensis TaxID=185542 RepID=A0ABC8RYV8_9AQUA
MASSSSRLSPVNSYAYAFLILITSTKNATGCYTSLFGFGDSLTDTGNLVKIDPPDHPPHEAFPPYGETFFHVPTGRSSDGRLIIDFIAEYYGLPLVPPYVEWKNEKRANFRQGVNFAVIGAPALDIAFYEERGIHNPVTNESLKVQLVWFKEILPSLCHSSSSKSKLRTHNIWII